MGHSTVKFNNNVAQNNTAFKQAYCKRGRAVKQYQIGVNYVFKNLLLILRLHKDIELVLEILESQGYSVTKSRVSAWQKKEESASFQAMPYYVLEAFIDGLKSYKLIDFDEADPQPDNVDLLVLRGIPGSGKTTYAEKLIAEGKADILVEADQFFMKEGEYHYNPNQIRQAHEYCRQKVRDSLKKGLKVVVANTFVHKWEVEPYLNMDVSVQIMKLEGDFKNVHDVPDGKVELMKERYEPFEDETSFAPRFMS